MKKNHLIAIMAIAVTSIFNSCSTEREIENESSQKLENSLGAKGSESCEIFNDAVESTMISGVKSVNFDNGLPTSCDKNILIFSSLQAYGDAIDKLDQMIEDHNNAFDQQTINMTDEQADDYADAVGFDENEPLTKFEDELKFCSLRREIETLEAEWLAQQTDGAWNISASPDDHFIDDETERALLSLGSEFIVGDCRTGYTLYKRYDWGYVSFPLNDPSQVSQALAALNNLPNPGQATQSQVAAALDPYKGSTGYNLNTTNPPASQASTCRGSVKDKGEHIFSSDRRIVWKHKLKDAHFPNLSGTSLMKTYTKSYRKKKGKWKTFRATIFTGYYGEISKPIQCTNLGPALLQGKERRRVKVKERSKMLIDVSVKQNEFFSVHKQEGNSYQNEVY